MQAKIWILKGCYYILLLQIIYAYYNNEISRVVILMTIVIM